MTAPKFDIDRSEYPDALARWFASANPDHADVVVRDLDIPVATGFSNETVFFTVDSTVGGEARSARLVGRIEPADGGMFPIQAPGCEISVMLQHKAMAAVAAATDVPMPPLVGAEADASVLGQPFFVMGFVDGRIPPDNPRYTETGFVVDEATPAERTRMVTTGLDAMAAIHAIDWRAADLGWLDSSGEAGPSTAHQIALYRTYVDNELAGREHPVMAHALDWLEANDPHDDRIGLAWGDARLGNIIWQDYAPAAVVDWEACALSPTEADLGWWLMFDRMSFDDAGNERMEGYPTREEQIAHYASVSGREVRDPHYWEVFAIMRFCAIFIRLGDRLVAGGLLPDEMNPAVGNMVTRALADRLGIDNPTPSLIG